MKKISIYYLIDFLKIHLKHGKKCGVGLEDLEFETQERTPKGMFAI